MTGTVAYATIDSQRRKEILANVPDEYKLLVAKAGAILADSNMYVCPWCEAHVPLDDIAPPVPRKRNEKAA